MTDLFLWKAGPPARFAPDRQAQEGTAERPGKRVQLATEAQALEQFKAEAAAYPEDIKVLILRLRSREELPFLTVKMLKIGQEVQA